MKRFLALFLILLVFAVLPSVNTMAPAYAADGGETDPLRDGPDTGGTCDLTELKASIQSTESSQGCAQRGPMTKYGRAQGKYQFIPPTWNRMAKGCPGASQCAHGSDAFFNSPVCCQVQECAMDNLLLANKAGIAKNANCQKIMGTTINSPKYGSCTVTESGLLAAWHLGGNDACDGPANGTYGDNDGHTYEADYICKHGGKPVPGNCKPNFESDPSQAPPIGTLQQLEIQEATESVVVVGSANGIKENWVAGLMLMAEQFTSNMAMQVEMIGALFDAKHQMETQRLFQQKMSEAHKDYSVSEQMCTFGTFTRDLIATERSADLSRNAISQQLLQREAGAGDSMGATGLSDSLSRIAQFRKKFCNPEDNGRGLKLLCPTAAPVETQNADINYTQSIDQPLSLDINLNDPKVTPDEEVVFALIDNLFAHETLPRIPLKALDQQKYQYHYMNLRSLMAMRGIARNSIANIIALKTATPNEIKDGGTAAPFLQALFRDFGLNDEEIIKLLGEKPSYYAQMELLTKKIYQSPSFYSGLYDKPANVKRIRAAMQAIKVMQDRDIQKSLQRREMLLSIMLEIRLRQRAESVYNAAEAAMFEAQ